MHFNHDSHNSFQLSPPQRLLCVAARLGEREKKKVRRAQWEGERKKKGHPPFPSSHRPPRAFYFSIIATFIGIPKGSLCREEGFFCTLSIDHDDHDSWTPKLVDQGVTKMSLPRPCPPPPPPHLRSLAFKVIYRQVSVPS